MGEITKIQWCDHTFNPWIGCTKVDEGCKNCYAEELMANRYGRVRWGNGADREKTKTWGDPIRWNKVARLEQVRRRVFCASLADVFDEEVSDQWRVELYEHVIEKCPDLDFLLLTKRPEKAIRFFSDRLGGMHPFNVWLGCSVSSEASKAKAEWLQRFDGTTFLSYEPALGYLDFSEMHWLNWVIIGGESGKDARPFSTAWAMSAIHQCKEIGASPFVKQMGSVWAKEHNAKDKKGGDPSEWPEALRVREFP